MHFFTLHKVGQVRAELYSHYYTSEGTCQLTEMSLIKNKSQSNQYYSLPQVVGDKPL